jgi:hypothetical protein
MQHFTISLLPKLRLPQIFSMKSPHHGNTQSAGAISQNARRDATQFWLACHGGQLSSMGNTVDGRPTPWRAAGPGLEHCSGEVDPIRR